MSLSAGQLKVFLYVPNLIGYARVALTSYALIIAQTDWQTAAICYTLSFVCDYFDGLFARALNQCSNFGAVLDMVTDRCSTAGLLVILGSLYKQQMIYYLFLLILDFSSHWIHMYSAKGHHKVVPKDKNFLLRVYYGVYPFFGYCCVGTELFYITRYIYFFQPALVLFTVSNTTITLYHLMMYVCFPAMVMKQAINVAQLCSAAADVAKEDSVQSAKPKKK